MKKYFITAIICILFAATSVQAQTLFSDNFNSQDFSGYDTHTPSSSTTTNGLVYVDSSSTPANPFSGYGLRFYDTSTSASTTLQENYSASSSTLQLIQYDIAISSGAASSETSSIISFRVANSGVSISSGSNAPFTIEFRMDGTVRIAAGSSYVSSTSIVSTSGSSFAIYTNTGLSTTITTIYGTSLTLASNQVAVYCNSSLLGTFNFSSSATGFTPSSGIESLGFTSASSSTGGDFIIDNLSVTAIPEPSTYALLIIGGALVLIPIKKRLFSFCK